MGEGRTRPATLRSVAMPAEHGGWGLTLEPGLLGVLVAPSAAGVLLAVAALLVFLARTPVRYLMVAWRHERSGRSAVDATSGGRAERRRLAGRVAVLEVASLVALIGLVLWLAYDTDWWLAGVPAAPLLALALWYDMRGLSRGLLPEVAGALAVASVAAMAARAGGADWTLALGLWLIQGSRIAASIPHVRAQVRRLHRQVAEPLPGLLGDGSALLAATAAFLLAPTLLLGGVAIVGLVVVQRITLLRPPRPARVLGVRQTVLGLAVVLLTALGTWLA